MGGSDLEAVQSGFGAAVVGGVPLSMGHEPFDLGNDVVYKESFEWTSLAINTMSLIADLLMLRV